MNKGELIEELSTRYDGSKSQASHALESVLDVIQRGVVAGEKVVITGFGSFEPVARAARTARNPATGATVKVKASKAIKFKPGAELKSIVNGTKKLPKIAAGAVSGARAAAKPAAKKTTAKKATAKKTTTRAAAPKKAVAKKTAKRAPAKKATRR